MSIEEIDEQFRRDCNQMARWILTFFAPFGVWKFAEIMLWLIDRFWLNVPKWLERILTYPGWN